MSKIPLEYIREQVPHFEEPSYPGRRYSALIPDTLDLQDRAALSINGLTGPTNPEADYEMYFMVYFRNKPMMSPEIGLECQAKFQESLPLMRLISGGDFNSHVDRRWMEATLHKQGPDGLLYHPVKGRPWWSMHQGLDLARLVENENSPGRLPPVGYRPLVSQLSPEIEKAGHFGSTVYNGRMLGALALYYQLTGDELWKKVGQRVVDGLRGVTQMRFWPGDTRSTESPDGAANGWVIQGLCQFFRATQYEPALELARWCVNEAKKSAWVFDGDVQQQAALERRPEGKSSRRIPFGWAGRPGRKPHFHSTTYMLLSLLEYATITGETELMALVREGYEYAKLLGQETVGFFPERVTHLWSESIKDRTDFRYETSETCEVADMIALGLKLTAAGQGDYWDEVDRWLRNQFAEAQLTDVEWVYRMTEDLALAKYDPSYQTTDRVPERNLGAFAGWPSANDWYTGGLHYRGYYPEYPGGMAIMHCCTGNATRAIYYAWEHILDYKDGKLRVNLLLNRVSPWADVDSHIPYEGHVDVRVKQGCDLSVRIPEWVPPAEVACQVNESRRSPQWEGRYARFGPVQPGDVAAISFPIPLRTEDISVQGSYYKIVRKGNEVVTIDPAGRYCPLYQRAHYRANSVRWRKANRFCAEKTVDW